MIFKTQPIASKTDNRLRQNVLEGGSEGERGVQRLQTHNASNQLLEDTSQVHHEKNTIWTKCASIHLQSFYRKNVSPCLSTFLHCHRRYEHKRPAPVTSSGSTPIPPPPHVLHLNEHFKSPQPTADLPPDQVPLMSSPVFSHELHHTMISSCAINLH